MLCLIHLVPIIPPDSCGEECLETAAHFSASLSDDGRRELFPNGQQPIFHNRVGWARTYFSITGPGSSLAAGAFTVKEYRISMQNLIPLHILGVMALFAVGCASQESVLLDGVKIDSLLVGPRDEQRRAPISMTITNKTAKDIPGMQVAFIANDDRGKMGPFWLPRMGNESEWAVKAGETRKIQAYITGFGVREMSSATPVEVRILGARLKEVSRRPESERRAIFTALVGCEDAATAQ